MDPVTHALAGAAVARVATARPLAKAAWLPGAVGGLLPDVDALIRSTADPLLYAEFHRHFTHAIAFIPIGGAIAALPWLLRSKHRPRWKAYLAAATAGYATHGVLDAATTWGTRLFWPFDEARVAWNWISIVDPVFTLILLVGVAVAAWRRRASPVAFAVAVAVIYLAAGALQHTRAVHVQARVAAARGHAIERGVVMPGFANNVVWRSLYEARGRLYTDRVRVPWWGSPSWSPGYDSVPMAERDLPAAAAAAPRVRRDFHRFATFANGWVAHTAEPGLIGDARYSLADDRFEPVWAIRYQTTSGPAFGWVNRSSTRRVSLATVWNEIAGWDETYRPVP